MERNGVRRRYFGIDVDDTNWEAATFPSTDFCIELPEPNPTLYSNLN